jgi:hypothetical protein
MAGGACSIVLCASKARKANQRTNVRAVSADTACVGIGGHLAYFEATAEDIKFLRYLLFRLILMVTTNQNPMSDVSNDEQITHAGKQKAA